MDYKTFFEKDIYDICFRDLNALSRNDIRRAIKKYINKD